MKKTIFIIVFSALILSACGQVPSLATETATVVQVPATVTLPPLPTYPPGSPLLIPTFDPNIIYPTTTATFSPKPIPVSTTTEIYPLDNLRMAYIVDGNLYLQNGSNPPKKLSDSGKDWHPIFSDDGEKIIFYRDEKINDNNSIFSVNADGSQMQEIISIAWLDTLGKGTKAGQLAFVPNTHQIFFNTYLCPDNDNMYSGCAVGLFLADTDTGKLKEIVKPALGGRLPLDGNSHWGGNFSISPDGNLLSIAHAGQIDIMSRDGKVIHRNIIEYPPGMPVELYPRIYWFSDSSGLIAALPAEKEYKFWVISGDAAYTIWRYTFDGNTATQIPLDPPLSWAHMESNEIISISPNREWIVYFTEGFKLYKGNLLDGSTDLLLPYKWFLPMLWSSDNIHFADGVNPEGYIFGSVDSLLGYSPGYFLGWIDAKRFVYFSGSAYQNKADIELFIGEFEGETILSHESNVFVPPFSYSFVFTVLENK